MEILTNDLSINKQFNSINSFRESLTQLMEMRQLAKNYRREVCCNRALLNTNPMPDVTMQQAIGKFACKSERRAVMAWLTRGGPFWDDMRQHVDDDWFECCGDIVTGTAVGEAAFGKAHGVDCGLVSFFPSDWNYAPVNVKWRRDNEVNNDRNVVLSNWWKVESFETALQNSAPPIRTWNDLELISKSRCTNLTFANDSFKPLKGVSFSRSSAKRIIFLLDNLNRLANSFDAQGNRTAEGHQIYDTLFVGRNALFSDSSNSEKKDFRNELSFPHPDKPDRKLDCTWHGKERHLKLRLHFSWSFEFDDPIYIVYVGQKLTRR